MEIQKEFQSVFPMDFNPLSNYLQYSNANREIYLNWCKSMCTPCLYRKIKKEGVNILPTIGNKTDFSRVDKYVIAYGTQSVLMDDTGDNYLDYEAYLPIQDESYSKLNAQFTESIQIDAPHDPRFDYKAGDLVIFKFNEFIYKFQVEKEPESYHNILYRLILKYVDKKRVDDLIQDKTENEDSREKIKIDQVDQSEIISVESNHPVTDKYNFVKVADSAKVDQFENPSEDEVW